MNDISNSSPLLHFILFADDTNVFFSHKSLTSLSMTVKQLFLTGLGQTSLILKTNNFVLFRSHHKIVTQEKFSLLIDNIPLTQIKSSKFLGVYVDEHLTWNVHINNISIKIAKSIGVISCIACLLPSNICLNLYYSLIYPYLS